MTRTLQHTVFVLLLLSACDRRASGASSDAANGDGGEQQDASPTAPNMVLDAAVDAAMSTDAGSGNGGSGGSADTTDSGGGSGGAAAGNGGAGGQNTGAGHSAPSDAGSAPDEDAGPGTPQVLCTSCGGCEQTIKVVSTMHTTNPVVYKDPPPTSGPHNPCWARWGIHDEPLAASRWVHNLEHGGVVFLYNCPEGCDAEIAFLKDVVSKRSRTIVAAYPDLPARFGVVSWGHRMVSECMDEAAFLEFYMRNFDHAPESNANPPNPNCPP